LLININSFGGCLPKMNPRLLPVNAAQVASNCKTETGTLRPYKNTTVFMDPPKTGLIKTIYHYLDQYVLHWLTDVDVAHGPVVNDVYNRIYWTGDGVPKVANSQMFAAGGGTNYPNASFPIGVPAPTTAPTITVTGDSTDEDLDESRAYVFTYVTAFGEEGPPSPSSTVVTVGPGQTVEGTFIVAPSGLNIVTKRFYRTITGTDSTEFRMVADVGADVTSAYDSVASENLNEALPSLYWDGPDPNLTGITLHPAGFMAGFHEKDVFLSEIYQPHAWPDSYKVPVEYDIIGLGIFGSSILVLTTGTPYAISGNDPSSMTVERLEINQSCMSKQGIVDVGDAIAYPSPDGLIVIGQGQAKNVTESIYTREQWNALSPSTMISAYHDGKYYGFLSNGTAIVLSPSGSDVTTLNISVSAVHVSVKYDRMSLMVGDNIVRFDDSATTNLGDIVWRSKVFVPPVPTKALGIAQVRASAYPLTFKLYADGVLKHTQTVANDEPFRLPGGYHFEEAFVEITSQYEIYSVCAASSVTEMKKAVHP